MKFSEIEHSLYMNSWLTQRISDVFRTRGFSYSAQLWKGPKGELTDVKCPQFYFTKRSKMSDFLYTPLGLQILLPWCINNSAPYITISHIETEGEPEERYEQINRALNNVGDPADRNIHLLHASGFTNRLAQRIPHYDEHLSKMLRNTPTTNVGVYFDPDKPESLTVISAVTTTDQMLKSLALSEALFPTEEKTYAFPSTLFLALAEDDFTKWSELALPCLTAYIDFFDINYITIQKELTAKRIMSIQKNAADRAINDAQAHINSYEAELRGYYESLHQAQAQKLYADQKQSNYEPLFKILKNKSEILEITMPRHDGTENTSKDNGYTEIHVYCPLDNFQIEGAKANIPRGTPTQEGLKDIFTDLFISEKYTLWVHAYFMLNFTDLSKSVYTPRDARKLSNPHFTGGLVCFGQNGSVIDKALHEQNFEMAIEFLVAAAHNYNTYDGFATRKLITELKAYESFWHDPCLQINETKEMTCLGLAYPELYKQFFHENFKEVTK